MRRALVVVVATLLVGGCSGSPEQAQQAAAPPPGTEPSSPATAPAATPSGVPPIPLMGAARPPEIVDAVYTFAANHPEVLGHVPCFCGCESRGHRNNDDCFVSGRDTSGRVTAWEPHGAT